MSNKLKDELIAIAYTLAIVGVPLAGILLLYKLNHVF